MMVRRLMPIVARLPEDERIDIRNIEGMKIWSPALSEYVPLQQVTLGYELEVEDERSFARTVSVC